MVFCQKQDHNDCQGCKITACDNHHKRRGEEMVQCFSELIIQQLNLPKNVEKGGWSDDNLEDLIERGIQEMTEIHGALYQFYGYPCEQTRQHVLAECGDAGAFAAMIADIVRKIEIPPRWEELATECRKLNVTKEDIEAAYEVHGRLTEEETNDR